MRSDRTPLPNNRNTLKYMTVLLPVPGPPSSKTGPGGLFAAARCIWFSVRPAAIMRCPQPNSKSLITMPDYMVCGVQERFFPLSQFGGR